MGPPLKLAKTESHTVYDDRLLPSITGNGLLDPLRFDMTSTSSSGRGFPPSVPSNAQLETLRKRTNQLNETGSTTKQPRWESSNYLDRLDSIEEVLLQESEVATVTPYQKESNTFYSLLERA